MRAGFASVVLATSLAAVSQAGTAAEPIMVVDFETATGIDSLIGVDQSQTPSRNLGFEGFFWAWNGSGVVVPDGPASAGFLLGNKNANGDFAYVGGSPPQFAYLSARVTDAYVTAMTEPFDFLGAIFSSQTPGTLVIFGQRKSANGIGGGTFDDVTAAIAKVTFDGVTEVVQFGTTDFSNIDRLVISSVDTNGKAASFQWTLNDFSYAPVPEPGTWAMFGLGVLGIGFAARRRKPRIR
jgi:hypothetical protein